MNEDLKCRWQRFEAGITDKQGWTFVVRSYKIFTCVLEKIELNEAAFKEEEGAILQRLRQERQSRFFGNHLQNAMDQLRQDQQLMINQEMINIML